MRWLVVSPYLPHPTIGHGGGIAVYQLCRALAAEHEATLLCFRREDEDGLEAPLVEAGVRVETVALKSNHARGLARVGLWADRLACVLRAAGRQRPLMVEKYDREAMHRRLHQLVDELRPHAVQIEYAFMAPYAFSTRFHVDDPAGVWQNRAEQKVAIRPHILLNTHELGSLPRLRRAAAAGSSITALRNGYDLARWAAHERRCVDGADTVLCVTEQDRILMQALTGATNLRTMPLGTDPSLFEPTSKVMPSSPPRLLFVGSFDHPPNVDGALALCEEILPRVWKQRADIAADIVGKNPPARLRALAEASEGRIVVHGFIDDLDAMFERAWVFVAPLTSGGGIKIKVLEAMGRGSAVVSTPIGAEGIDDRGEALALAPDYNAFATSILELVQSPELRRELGERARARIVERFSWAAIVRSLAQCVEESPRT